MSSTNGPAESTGALRRRAMILAWSLAGAAFVAYQLAVHRIVSSDPHGIVAELLAALPLLLFAAWLAGRSRLGPFAGAATLALGVAGCMAWNRAGTDGLLPVLPHLAIYLLLLAWFGASLRPGREPLVTFMARHVHDSMSVELLAYTRRVTAAWCVFFFVMGATSLALFMRAPIETWSLFANLLNVPLVIAMFLAEYGWRRLRHPHMSRATVPTMIRAFMKLGSAGGESSRG
jgi:uncharacterized membrane protein